MTLAPGGIRVDDYNVSFTDAALSLAVSRSGSSSISAKASFRHGGSGCGSMISSLLSLSMSMVFSASANGKRAYDPILFLRFWALNNALQMG